MLKTSMAKLSKSETGLDVFEFVGRQLKKAVAVREASPSEVQS